MFRIKIAGLIIDIDNKYRQIQLFCNSYITQETGDADISISVNNDELAAECKNYATPPSPAYAESICVYRKICLLMPNFDAFLLHSSVVEYRGNAYAFAAVSGTGKTTHTMLWLKVFGSNARIINGDKPILRFTDNKVLAYGTPWCGKEGFNVNSSAPLAALCFIERAEKNSIERLQNNQSVRRLFSQLLIPSSESELDTLMVLIDRLLKTVPCYLLKCNISTEAVDVAYNAMNPDNNL